MATTRKNQHKSLSKCLAFPIKKTMPCNFQSLTQFNFPKAPCCFSRQRVSQSPVPSSASATTCFISSAAVSQDEHSTTLLILLEWWSSMDQGCEWAINGGGAEGARGDGMSSTINNNNHHHRHNKIVEKLHNGSGSIFSLLRIYDDDGN